MTTVESLEIQLAAARTRVQEIKLRKEVLRKELQVLDEETVRYIGTPWDRGPTGIVANLSRDLKAISIVEHDADRREVVWIKRPWEFASAFVGARYIVDKVTPKPDFHINYEAYEVFCCQQAVLFARICPTVTQLQVFKEMSWGDQVEQITDEKERAAFQGHSGNTFYCAIGLARMYIESPEFILKAHGALAPLVGSAEYETPTGESA